MTNVIYDTNLIMFLVHQDTAYLVEERWTVPEIA